KGRFMLRPEGLLAPHRQGLLLSSFRRMDRSKPASRITTRANSQFPRPDLHRQETRHYGLRAKTQRIECLSDVFPYLSRVLGHSAIQRNSIRAAAFFAPLRELLWCRSPWENPRHPRYRSASVSRDAISGGLTSSSERPTSQADLPESNAAMTLNGMLATTRKPSD